MRGIDLLDPSGVSGGESDIELGLRCNVNFGSRETKPCIATYAQVSGLPKLPKPLTLF